MILPFERFKTFKNPTLGEIAVFLQSCGWRSWQTTIAGLDDHSHGDIWVTIERKPAKDTGR